jgi:sugar phosphate isomerase/epimerase
LCFGSYDRLIKEATRNRFEYSYGISQKLGCKHIILHHGYVPGTSYPPNWIKRGKIFWDDFLRDKSDDTFFHIENMLEFTPDLIMEMVSTVSDARLDVCLDVGHAHCNSKTPVCEWIKKLNKQIGFVHLHNNYGQKDEHLGFKKGTIDFLDICHALEEYAPDSIWGIETNINDMEDSILWLKKENFL